MAHEAPPSMAHEVYTRPIGAPVFKGCSLDAKDGRWRVRINCGGRRIFLGKWTDAYMAARVYDRAAVVLNGSAASTNFGADAALADDDCPIRPEVLAQLLAARDAAPQRRKPWQGPAGGRAALSRSESAPVHSAAAAAARDAWALNSVHPGFSSFSGGSSAHMIAAARALSADAVLASPLMTTPLSTPAPTPAPTPPLPEAVWTLPPPPPLPHTRGPGADASLGDLGASLGELMAGASSAQPTLLIDTKHGSKRLRLWVEMDPEAAGAGDAPAAPLHGGGGGAGPSQATHGAASAAASLAPPPPLSAPAPQPQPSAGGAAAWGGGGAWGVGGGEGADSDLTPAWLAVEAAVAALRLQSGPPPPPGLPHAAPSPTASPFLAHSALAAALQQQHSSPLPLLSHSSLVLPHQPQPQFCPATSAAMCMLAAAAADQRGAAPWAGGCLPAGAAAAPPPPPRDRLAGASTSDAQLQRLLLGLLGN